MSAGYLATAVVLLGLNAFFVAVEFALVTSRRERLEPLAAEGRGSARLGLAAMGELSLQLAGAQLGITMASLGLGFVGEPAVARLLEPLFEAVRLPSGAVDAVSLGVALALVSYLHLVLGEMVPKNLAIAGPERTLLVLARPNAVYVRTFRPVIRLLNDLASAGVRLLGREPRDELAAAHTAEELSMVLRASQEEGVIDDFEHELLRGALDFADRPVTAAMVPREQIVAVPFGCTVGDVERIVDERGHSRIPVTGRDLDDLLGFIHVKDLLRLGRSDALVPVRTLRRMLIVRDDRTLEDVLLRMQAARLHLAVVVDAERHTLGMVSLEDVLEVLVGDIRDESDRDESAGP
ncbi:MAG: HlyC/CorC family transporter [Actinobacteria bacterium]|nr:HlyC/CorC family transporter [Actinomycetota bacterium]